MSLSLRASCCALGILMATLALMPTTGWAQRQQPLDPKKGQELFERVWEPESELLTTRDGLGPLFNERSCVACHFLGGVGGAGPNAKNVQLISADVPDDSREISKTRNRLSALHKGFGLGSTFVLHRYSTDPLRYTDFRTALLGRDMQGIDDPLRRAVTLRAILRGQGRGPVKTIKHQGDRLLLSERNTPPLFGIGLIDSIPESEIKKVASQQTAEDPTISGRFVGRFGWRGQTRGLDSFIRGACATELGLQVSTNTQAIDPLADEAKPAKMLDLTDGQCRDLTAFVARLPAPGRVEPTGRRQRVSVRNGEKLFNAVGCAVCHRKTLGPVSGLYSDLLVHDMGSNLIDPSPAPVSATVPTSATSPTQYYSGGGSGYELPTPLVLARRREWKTPPLWGLRDSRPYLHDGRAATVEEAIAYHGGEAAGAVDRYLAMPAPERAQVVAFLSTLAAPKPVKD